MKYNFAFKDNRLKRWINPSLTSQPEKSKSNNYNSFTNYLFKHPITYSPSLIAILLFSIIKSLSIIPQNKINTFENAHMQYNNLNYQINNSVNKKRNMESQFDSFEIFYQDLAPIYLFTFYLQNSIPEKVTIYEIIIDQYGYKINAGSPNLDILNKMVTLMVESPLVNLETISMNEIFNEETSSEQKKQKTSVFKAEIKGSLKSLNLDNKMALYKETSAGGLLKKLSIYKDLGALFN